MATDLTAPLTRVIRGCRVTHNINPDLVLTVRPGGVLQIRELGRRAGVIDLDLGTLYSQALWKEAWQSQKRK